MPLRSVRFTYVNPQARVYAVQRLVDGTKPVVAITNRLFHTAPIELETGTEYAVLAFTVPERAYQLAHEVEAQVHDCCVDDILNIAELMRMPAAVVVGPGPDEGDTDHVFFKRPGKNAHT